MSRIELFLNRVEAHLRLAIEGDAAGSGIPRRLHRLLERELTRAMKAGARSPADNRAAKAGRLVAPDEYTLVLPAIEAQILLTHPAELDRLAHKLEHAASQGGMVFTSAPVLRVVADPQANSVDILVGFFQPGSAESHTYQLDDLEKAPGRQVSEKLPKAFLIVNGLSTFLLSEPLINIGRDPSNQLQLDDPQISRKHAQLRFIQGRFVIFDLDSRCGTFVNGVPVSSHVLNPGDVVLLAHVPLVYGQEDKVTGSQTQELPADPPAPEVL